jgi:hypothetical protein
VSSKQEENIQRVEKPEESEIQMKSLVQRREAIGGGEASTDLESAINSAKGGGQTLDAGLQRSMGEAMGADFSGVRVHTDTQADMLSRSIQAKAFTTGQDVFFRQGAYEPGSRGGQELIAHELTHVVQQKGGELSRKEGKEQGNSVELVGGQRIQREMWSTERYTQEIVNPSQWTGRTDLKKIRKQLKILHKERNTSDGNGPGVSDKRFLECMEDVERWITKHGGEKGNGKIVIKLRVFSESIMDTLEENTGLRRRVDREVESLEIDRWKRVERLYSLLKGGLWYVKTENSFDEVLGYVRTEEGEAIYEGLDRLHPHLLSLMEINWFEEKVLSERGTNGNQLLEGVKKWLDGWWSKNGDYEGKYARISEKHWVYKSKNRMGRVVVRQVKRSRGNKVEITRYVEDGGGELKMKERF